MRHLSIFRAGGGIMMAVLFMFMFCSSPVCAQPGSNINHLQLSVGALYERGFDTTLAYEHETKYHNAWEYFINGYIKYADDPEAGHITKNSFWNHYRTWLFGIAYKPCIVRHRNGHGNFRFGLMAGSDTKKFIGGGTVGYEHSYALRHGWEFFFQVKSDFVIRGKDFFRTGVALGMKVPI